MGDFDSFDGARKSQLLNSIFRTFPRITSTRRRLDRLIRNGRAVLGTVTSVDTMTSRTRLLVRGFSSLPIERRVVSGGLCPTFTR